MEGMKDSHCLLTKNGRLNEDLIRAIDRSIHSVDDPGVTTIPFVDLSSKIFCIFVGPLGR